MSTAPTADEMIPHTVEPHPVTGLYNGKLGIWLFLASEVMLFGALFSTYILLRVGATDWPQGIEYLNVPLATVNTLILITSSVTMVMAWASLKLNDIAKGRIYLWITVLLACGFLVVKAFEYGPKLQHHEVWLVSGESYKGHIISETEEQIVFHPDATAEHDHPEAMTIEIDDIQRRSAFTPGHSNFLAIYWTMTSLHAVHVIGGIIVIAFLAGPGVKMFKTDPERFTNRIECTGLYWHFVDLVWIFLFPTLYLL